MQLTEHLSFEELTATSHLDLQELNRAEANKCLPRLRTLAEMLEVIRTVTGPLIVNSGFRCVKLNIKVGGVATSQHCFGEAADIHMQCSDVFKLYEIAQELHKMHKLTFRQLILEESHGAKWVHVAMLNGDGKIGECLAYKDGKYELVRTI